MEICYPVQTCVAVEYAAVHGAAVVAHTAREGAVVDGAVVLDFVVERTVFDHAVVLDRVLERAIHDAARSHIVDLAVEGAAQNAAVVEHFAVELAARDGRRLAHKDVALHRRTISDGAEIEQPAGLVAARQKQHVAIGRVIGDVLPAVALAGVFAAVGILRPAVLHDEVGAGDRSVQHHVIVRHGKGHGLLVDAVAAFCDGLAVQAENLGVGSDGHFLRRGIAGHDVGGPIRRHTVDFLDLGTGGHGDGVEICYPVQTCVAVEYAAVYVILIFHTTREGAAGDVAPVCHTALEGSVSDRSVVVFHCTTEGSARDFSWVVVFHVFLKDAVLYGAYVYHPVLEGAVLDGAFVSHVARKGAVLYGAVVFHFFISGEGTVLYGAPVFHFSIEGAFLDGAFVCHFSIEGAAGNFHTRLSLNRTRHRRIGRYFIGSRPGIG